MSATKKDFQSWLLVLTHFKYVSKHYLKMSV